MNTQKKFTVAQVEEAILAYDGILTSTAKALGTTRRTVYRYLQKYPHLQRVCQEARETVVDEAERSLFYLMRKHDHWAVGKVLDAFGKRRGYGAPGKDEEEHDNAPIQQHINEKVLRRLVIKAMESAGYEENSPYAEWWVETTVAIIKQYQGRESKKLMRELSTMNGHGNGN